MVLPGHFQQRVQVSLIRVHAAVGDQAEQMQLPAATLRVLHGVKQHGILEELAVQDHELNARRVHVHDAPGADVQVPHFAIAHLPFGQADVWTAGLDQGIGIFAQQALVGRLVRQRDGIEIRFRAVTPAVEDDQNQRFRTRHSARDLPVK